MKEFLLDLFFPKFCISCQKEGDYLCEDCLSLLEILEYSFCLCKKPQRLPDAGRCKRCKHQSLNGLFFAFSYENLFAKKLISQFKYNPQVKELAKTLSFLIIAHFNLLEKPLESWKDFILVPVPLTNKKKRKRGFNQAEELGKELRKSLGIPLVKDCLLKIKETPPQIELQKEERLEAQKGVFLVKNKGEIKERKLLLVDDVYTTGATMKECAKVLKIAGAKEVWGVAIARG